MIFQVDKDLYYDNEKMYIIKGEENKVNFLENYDDYSYAFESSSSLKYPTIIFLASTACNLKCKYCFAEEGTYGNVSKTSQFKLLDYIEIYDTIYEQYGGISQINFFGGEPLLNFNEIKKFVEYIHNKYDSNKLPLLSVSSNGTIMDQEIKEFLKKYKIAFGTSLDGIKKHNDLNRVGINVESVYDSVVETLDYLSDHKVKKGLQFTFNYTHLTDYKKNDFIKWAKEFEKLDIDFYEITPVTSDTEGIQIDVNDKDTLDKFLMLCDDISNYSIDALVTGSTTKIPRIFIGIMLSIIKRKFQRECSAGKSFAFSPDKIVYPCHMCADNDEYGVKFDKNFIKNIEQNSKFQHIKNMKKRDFDSCNSCISKNVCAYFCKGLMDKTDYSLLEPRCIMMNRFTEQVIRFMATRYKDNKDSVEANILKIYSLNYGMVHEV